VVIYFFFAFCEEKSWSSHANPPILCAKIRSFVSEEAAARTPLADADRIAG
jgi:hypothetical protein